MGYPTMVTGFPPRRRVVPQDHRPSHCMSSPGRMFRCRRCSLALPDDDSTLRRNDVCKMILRADMVVHEHYASQCSVCGRLLIQFLGTLDQTGPPASIHTGTAPRGRVRTTPCGLVQLSPRAA